MVQDSGTAFTLGVMMSRARTVMGSLYPSGACHAPVMTGPATLAGPAALSSFGQGDVQLENRAVIIPVHLHLNHVIINLDVFSDNRKQFLLELRDRK